MGVAADANMVTAHSALTVTFANLLKNVHRTFLAYAWLFKIRFVNVVCNLFIISHFTHSGEGAGLALKCEMLYIIMI